MFNFSNFTYIVLDIIGLILSVVKSNVLVYNLGEDKYLLILGLLIVVLFIMLTDSKTYER